MSPQPAGNAASEAVRRTSTLGHRYKSAFDTLAEYVWGQKGECHRHRAAFLQLPTPDEKAVIMTRTHLPVPKKLPYGSTNFLSFRNTIAAFVNCNKTKYGLELSHHCAYCRICVAARSCLVQYSPCQEMQTPNCFQPDRCCEPYLGLNSTISATLDQKLAWAPGSLVPIQPSRVAVS